ncbi:hypothetical protein [Martelella lutilitoris]|nr:hypothetical protein [Martelella lutilitoris]
MEKMKRFIRAIDIGGDAVTMAEIRASGEKVESDFSVTRCA